jgi:hypothetical protein
LSVARARDKRKTLRVRPFIVACRVAAAGRQIDGYVTDLSARGARVSTDSEVPDAGTSVRIELRLGRRDSVETIDGQVKWVRPSEGRGQWHSFGVTFLGLRPEVAVAIEGVVEDFRRRAAQL